MKFLEIVQLLTIESQADYEADTNLTNTNAVMNRRRLEERKMRFRRNVDRVRKGFSQKVKLNTPKNALREIFAYFKRIDGSDLLRLINGEKISENLINLYFRILEKINQVLVQSRSHQNNQS